MTRIPTTEFTLKMTAELETFKLVGVRKGTRRIIISKPRVVAWQMLYNNVHSVRSSQVGVKDYFPLKS